MLPWIWMMTLVSPRHGYCASSTGSASDVKHHNPFECWEGLGNVLRQEKLRKPAVVVAIKVIYSKIPNLSMRKTSAVKSQSQKGSRIVN